MDGLRARKRGRVWERTPLLAFFICLLYCCEARLKTATIDDGEGNGEDYVPSPPVPIIILTRGRSGSTLLGELFNADPSVLYSYEPCRIQQSGKGVAHIADEECADLAIALTKCAFDNPSQVSTLFGDISARKMSAALTRMVHGPLGAELSLQRQERDDGRRWMLRYMFNQECMQSRAVVAKVIRINFVPYSLVTSGVRIVELVRDPRAVVLSQAHTSEFTRYTTLASIADTTCEAALRTRQELASLPPGILCNVKFEELALRPKATLYNLYQCLGLGKPPASTTQWILRNMKDNGRYASVSRYTQHRNATDIVSHWADRWKVSSLDKATINEACATAVKAHGYQMDW